MAKKIGTHGTDVETGRAKAPKCPLSKDQFQEKAAPLIIKLGENASMMGEVKEFSTGSFGWHGQGKVTLLVDGKPLAVQANVILTVVGSKEA